MPVRRRAPGDPVRIATRGSELALRQARQVQQALMARGVVSELKTFTTVGDRKLDVPLASIGGKGLFTQELEEALAKGTVDCCVHSLKDLPTQAPDGLPVLAVLQREDPRDVVVLNSNVFAERLEDIPRGSRIGTSSLRRRAQLHALRPDLEVVELRGNVPTRLRKVEDGQVHAAILAAAGLHRLDANQSIAFYLDPPRWISAAGQGAIAVQGRANDDELRPVLEALNHEPTAIAIAAERTCLAALEGGCQVPIGVIATETDGRWTLHGFLSDVKGKHVVREHLTFERDDAREAGERLASIMRLRGGEEILEGLREASDLPKPQPE
ncbi:MAG TPA: hydroxymethylbilane synthase [Gemmatimonadaceae bacterium]|nr:hydroxymethylbilane synthase [Gemmatimonadaceae bacterium]